MEQVEWIATSDLLARLPEGDAWLKRFIKLEFLGSRDVPAEIPLSAAVALAACAQAKARGVPRYGRVFELVRSSPESIDDHLVVAPRSGRLRLEPVDGFEPVSAVVIDLHELLKVVRSGEPIPG